MTYFYMHKLSYLNTQRQNCWLWFLNIVSIKSALKFKDDFDVNWHISMNIFYLNIIYNNLDV